MKIAFKNNNITVFQSALVQTNTTIVETKDLVLVVDPNWLPQEVDQVANHVEEIKNERSIYLLFTHSDFDHVLGYSAFSDVETIASLGVKEQPEKEAIIEKVKAFDAQLYIKRPYPLKYPVIDHVIQEDGQQLTIGDTVFTFYLSPGHTSDGLFTVIDSVGALIAGDYLTDVEFPFIKDSRDYENTLEKVDAIIENHRVRLLIPGHGQPTEDMDDIHKRKQADLRYIRMLKAAVLNNDYGEVEQYIRGYDFIDGIISSHHDNVKVLKQELGTE